VCDNQTTQSLSLDQVNGRWRMLQLGLDDGKGQERISIS
jgi:hypothetical protein